MPKLCRDCLAIRNNPQRRPTHLYHPERGVRDLWDTHGRACCPKCFACWRRNTDMSYTLIGRLTLSGLIVEWGSPDP